MDDSPFSVEAVKKTLSPSSRFTIPKCLWSVAEPLRVCYTTEKYSLIEWTENSERRPFQ